MNMYDVLKKRQSEEFSKFPIVFAFNMQQFENGVREKLGLNLKEDLNKICRVGGSGFIRKSDSKVFHEMLERHDLELKEAIEKDSDGTGFIKDMFKSELAKHEYCISYDYEDTFGALGLTQEEVFTSEKLLNGLKLAKEEYMKSVIF